MSHAYLPSPIGPITVTADGALISGIRIGGTAIPATDDSAVLREAIAQLTAYFAGRLTAFDLPLAPAATPRGPAHRAAIAGIGFGDTASYGQLARAIASSPRAIGQACRRNPLPIVVPCHRVLGAGAAIGYYSAGDGVATKRWLLDHEQRRRNEGEG